MMEVKFKSLTAKFIFISLIIGAVLAVYFYVDFRFTHHIKGEAARINIAGRQRMLAAKMMYSAKGILDPLASPAEREEYRSVFNATVNEYEEALYGLRGGSQKLGMKPLEEHYKDSISQLNALVNLWQKTQKPVLLSIKEFPLGFESQRPERRNEACVKCHAAVRGNLKDVDAFVKSLERNHEKEIEDFNALKFSVLGLLLIAAGFIILYIRQSIIKPIWRLSNATKEIEKGNFDIKVDVKTSDEIGTFSKTFNSMTQSLALLFMEKAAHLREMGALNQISAAASKSLTFEIMLNGIMDAIMELEPLRLEKKGAIFLCDENSKTLKLEVSRNFSDEHTGLCATVPYGECLCGLCAEKNEILISEGNVADKRHTRIYPDIKEHAQLLLPLKSRDKMLGVVNLYFPAKTKLSGREIELYNSIADIISVALQNALNHRQVAMLAQSLDSSIDLIVITDNEGTISHANPQVYEYLGYTQDEIKGKNVSVMQSPNNPAGLGEEIYKKTINDGVWEGEVINIRKNGTEYPVFLTTSPVKDDSGNIVALIGISRDMTEIKKKEETLKKSEAGLRDAQRIAHLGNWDWDLVKNELKWSDEVYRIFGLKSSEFGETYEEFLNSVHSDDREFVKNSVNDALYKKMPYSIDHRIVLPDATKRIVHEQAEVTFDETGKPIRMVGTVLDVTEQKHAEETIKRNLQIQNILNSLLNVSLEGIPLKELLVKALDIILSVPFLPLMPKGGIFVVEDEPDVLILTANRGFSVPIQAICARVPFGRCLCGRAAASKQIQFADCLDERHENRYDGITPHGHYNVPIMSMGKVLGVLVLYLQEGHRQEKSEIEFLQAVVNTLAGIIERKKIEDELRKYSEKLEDKVRERTQELENVNLAIQVVNQELQARKIEAEEAKFQAEAANRAKSDFLANMSHELRTPLNSIIGFSEVMRDGMAGTVTDDQKEYLKDIWESGKHLLRLINDVLDLSKVEAGKMEIELSEFNLKELIDGSLVMFKEKAMKHNIKVKAEVKEGIGNIIADERKIKQVLFNLLSNALKFTPDGGSVRVQARLVHCSQSTVHGKEEFICEPSTVNRELADFVEISVSDTGIGIAHEDMGKLFQSFQQIESVLTKQYEGTGLGLKLCKDFVELHGGKIWAESELGKGSRFIFVIPLRNGSETPGIS
ncbi:MAG: PAS domain-containing protein [Thermodesulfovibrionales bacterium]